MRRCSGSSNSSARCPRRPGRDARGGTLTLSIVAPDQYRGQILDLIAADARAIAARFGPDYAVEARGLDRPVEWRRASSTEVVPLRARHQLVVRAGAPGGCDLALVTRRV